MTMAFCCKCLETTANVAMEQLTVIFSTSCNAFPKVMTVRCPRTAASTL